MAVMITVLLIAILVLSLVYLWFGFSHTYWRRRGIPSVTPTPIIGNLKTVFQMKTTFGRHLSDIYCEPTLQHEAAVGVYTLHQPGLLLREPELIKAVLIKDFSKFSNRFSRADWHHDKLGAYNLFFVRNPHWKDMRTKLTPIFTSGKIKQMYPLMLEIATELENYLAKHAQLCRSGDINLKNLCSRFTTDVIATLAFGVRANALTNEKADFWQNAQLLSVFTPARAFAFFIAFFLPKLVSPLRVKVFPAAYCRFIRNAIAHVMADRERSGVQRNDLIDALILLKQQSSDDQPYSKDFDFLVAQAGVFFNAGFETSSATMSFALYELSKQPALQERLRAEICDMLCANDGLLTYERIHELEYLAMVINETLRLYPVLPFLDREHQQLPNEAKFSLKPYYDYELENGMAVYIPIYGIQRDPKYWPNPNHFDPERFNASNKPHINPATYLPFGTGPHQCIGTRIGLLQAKIGLVSILKNHYVRPCAGQEHVEKRFDISSILLQFEGGIKLEIIADNLYANTTT